MSPPSNKKSLGKLELIAIALGGMVGGGIFTILGISVSMVGVFTPLAIVLGGGLASLAAYSYVKLGVYYKTEGATYSFIKSTFPGSPFASSLIGWWVIFGYISTLALYAYTFSSYALSSSSYSENELMRKLVAGGIILVFTLINIWSVKGMGKIEDILVYTKLIILAVISFVLMSNGQTSLPHLFSQTNNFPLFNILVVTALTFVAFEGFQLVINAVDEMESPEKNIPFAIYSAIGIAIAIYVVISLGAILTIPFEELIQNQEYALASGAGKVLGHWGTDLVILGALLATSSAISGTLFGASRQIAVIAEDGFFPKFLSKRKDKIPTAAIVSMASLAFLLILIGNLKVILEFGSVTFLLVSIVMAYTNLKIRDKTNASFSLSILSIVGLSFGLGLILFFEATHQIEQLYFIFGLYILLTSGAFLYSRKKHAL